MEGQPCTELTVLLRQAVREQKAGDKENPHRPPDIEIPPRIADLTNTKTGLQANPLAAPFHQQPTKGTI